MGDYGTEVGFEAGERNMLAPCGTGEAGVVGTKENDQEPDRGELRRWDDVREGLEGLVGIVAAGWSVYG